MSDEDRVRWDLRYAARQDLGADDIGPPAVFTRYAEMIPTAGRALDVACGRGASSVWLAQRGMDVLGIDVSPVAVRVARELARRHQVTERCRIDVADLDAGLPAGPPVNMLLCNMFRDPRLYGALVDRLAPGGLLAISVLSEVGAEPGPFRAREGELTEAFGALQVIAAHEADGRAWLLGRR